MMLALLGIGARDGVISTVRVIFAVVVVDADLQEYN